MGAKRNPNADDDAPEDEKYDWFPVRGVVSGSYDDYQICAGNDTVRRVIDDVLPYNTQENTIPYNSAYLSGFSAERYAARRKRCGKRRRKSGRTSTATRRTISGARALRE